MVSAFNVAASAQPTDKQLAPVLPQIQIYHHEADQDFPNAFTELSFRNEGFKSAPYAMEAPVAY